MCQPRRTSHPQSMTTETTHIPEIRRAAAQPVGSHARRRQRGLAEYFEIHPAVFRVGFVVLTLLGGAGVIIYAAAALVMPDEGKDDSIVTAALRNRRDRPWPLIGVALLAVALAALLSRVTFWPDGDSWFLFLLAGAVILWITRHPPPTLRRARRGARCGGLAPSAAGRQSASRSPSRRSSRSRLPPSQRSPGCSTCTPVAASATAPTSSEHVRAQSDLPPRLGTLDLDLGGWSCRRARRTSTRASTSASST
jgi:hypothetical protein